MQYTTVPHHTGNKISTEFDETYMHNMKRREHVFIGIKVTVAIVTNILICAGKSEPKSFWTNYFNMQH